MLQQITETVFFDKMLYVLKYAIQYYFAFRFHKGLVSFFTIRMPKFFYQFIFQICGITNIKMNRILVIHKKKDSFHPLFVRTMFIDSFGNVSCVSNIWFLVIPCRK